MVGGGIHSGPVVEGLVGSEHYRLFDVRGDNVNTAKRLCESAMKQELLVSQDVFSKIQGLSTHPPRETMMKGKQEPQQVYPLLLS